MEGLIDALKMYNTILVDMNHRTPAAAEASSNVMRCKLAAVTVSPLQNMIDAFGIVWTFLFMGRLCLLVTSFFSLTTTKANLGDRSVYLIEVLRSKIRYILGLQGQTFDGHPRKRLA